MNIKFLYLWYYTSKNYCLFIHVTGSFMNEYKLLRELSDSDSSDDENDEPEDEFEYGHIEATDSQKTYITLEIGVFAYKLRLRELKLVYQNHHRKRIFDVLEMGYGIKFTNSKNNCFIHSEVEEESELRVCYKCKLYATQNTIQTHCEKCSETLTLIKVKGLQTSMVVHVCLFLINIPENMHDDVY